MEIVKAVVNILEAVFPTFFSLNPSQQLCQSYYPHFTVGKTELAGRNSWIYTQAVSSRAQAQPPPPLPPRTKSSLRLPLLEKLVEMMLGASSCDPMLMLQERRRAQPLGTAFPEEPVAR